MMASRVTKTNYIRAETNFLIVIRYFAWLFFLTNTLVLA